MARLLKRNILYSQIEIPYERSHEPVSENSKQALTMGTVLEEEGH